MSDRRLRKRKAIERSTFTSPRKKLFATLPAELLFLIVSFIPKASFPFISKNYYEESHVSRSATLFNLSQTCQCLRQIVYPMIWESLEVCHFPPAPYKEDGSPCTLPGERRAGHSLKDFSDWQREISWELTRQLEIVTIREPSRAASVQSMTLIFSGFSCGEVHTEFRRCLPFFNSLQKLQILWTYSSLSPKERELRQLLFRLYGGGVKCPTVHTLVLNRLAWFMLLAFPEVRNIIFINHREPYQRYPRPQLLGYVANFCPKTEYINLPNRVSLFRCDFNATNFPNLREYLIGYDLADVSRYSTSAEFNAQHLSSMKHLSSIRFRTYERHRGNFTADMQERIKAAEQLLCSISLPLGTARQLKIEYHSNEAEGEDFNDANIVNVEVIEVELLYLS